MLETNLEKLHALARALLERESLDGEEIARILRVPPLRRRPAPPEPLDGAGSALRPFCAPAERFAGPRRRKCWPSTRRPAIPTPVCRR